MAFSTLLSLFLFFLHSLMLIGYEILLIEGQPLVIVFFLILLWSLGKARNKPLWPTPVLKRAYSSTKAEYHALADTTSKLF